MLSLLIGTADLVTARAEVSIVKTDGWELYTQGRVNVFLSYGWGDAIPIARDGEIIPASGAPLPPALGNAPPVPAPAVSPLVPESDEPQPSTPP